MGIGRIVTDQLPPPTGPAQPLDEQTVVSVDHVHLASAGSVCERSRTSRSPSRSVGFIESPVARMQTRSSGRVQAGRMERCKAILNTAVSLNTVSPEPAAVRTSAARTSCKNGTTKQSATDSAIDSPPGVAPVSARTEVASCSNREAKIAACARSFSSSAVVRRGILIPLRGWSASKIVPPTWRGQQLASLIGRAR